MQSTHFATFGSNHLIEFDIPGGPMKVMLLSIPGQTEEEFRELLHCKPFDGRFCTTYKIEEAERMSQEFGMVKYSIAELFEKRISNELDCN